MSPKTSGKLDKITSTNTAFNMQNGERRILIHPRCKRIDKSTTNTDLCTKYRLAQQESRVDHAFDAFGYLYLQQFNLVKPETLGQTSFRIY